MSVSPFCPVVSHLVSQDADGTNDAAGLLTLQLVSKDLPPAQSGMETQAVYMLLLLVCSDVASDWIEVPQISVSSKSNLQNVSSVNKLTTFSTPIVSVFTEVLEATPLSSTPNEQPTKKKVALIESLPIMKYSYHKVTDLEKSHIINSTYTETAFKETLHTLNDKSQFENSEASNYSDIVNETLEEAKSDLFNKPNTSLSQKLKYLHKMETEMSAQIKKISQGLWTDRQARGKKPLGFASMEGALMTIAFLTFAVFLVKVVHQFIRGLQDSELAMVELPTTPALRLSRPKRQQKDLAAAQLLHYMDEFRIKHRICYDSV